jgi:hypothetical protein
VSAAYKTKRLISWDLQYYLRSYQKWTLPTIILHVSGLNCDQLALTSACWSSMAVMRPDRSLSTE